MIPKTFLNWATSGAYDEKYLELLILRQQARDAFDEEHQLIMEIFEESDRRLEYLQNVYSPEPILRDVIDDILEKKK